MSVRSALQRLLNGKPAVTPLGAAIQSALDDSPEALRAALRRWDAEDRATRSEAGVWRFHEAGARARERVRRGEMARGVGGRFVGCSGGTKA